MKIDITKNPLTQHSLDNARLSIIELQSRLSVRKRNVLSAGYTIGGMCMSLMVVLGSTGAFSYAYFVNVLMAGVFGILVSVYHVAQICMNLKMTESFYSAFLGVTISMVVGSSLGFLQEPNLAAAGAFFGMTSMLVASLIANLWNKYINEPVTEANEAVGKPNSQPYHRR
jgi:ABC-type phosphate/phosphonate transport system permease subunit